MYPQMRPRKTIPMGAILGIVLIVLAARYHMAGAVKIGGVMVVASVFYGSLIYGRKTRF